MPFPKNLGKKLGHNIRVPKAQKRRLEKKPPAGMSLSKWRKQKPKKPVPFLGRKQTPVETVSQANKRIALVMGLYRGGPERFAHLTGLLSAAYAAKKPDKKAIAVIEQARDKLILNLAVEKEQFYRAKPPLQNTLSETTDLHIKSLKSQLAKKNFRTCQNLILVLSKDTPKTESRIVANLLESISIRAKAKILSAKNPDPDYINTIMKLYYASGELFKKGNFLDKAEEMFLAADVLKTKMYGR